MECVCCGSAAATERPERTARGYRRFRCRDCGRQFNERSAGLLNRTQYPSDVVALVVLWRLRYRLTLRDLRGCVRRSRCGPDRVPGYFRGWRPWRRGCGRGGTLRI